MRRFHKHIHERVKEHSSVHSMTRNLHAPLYTDTERESEVIQADLVARAVFVCFDGHTTEIMQIYLNCILSVMLRYMRS